jgi:hypothetical protein
MLKRLWMGYCVAGLALAATLAAGQEAKKPNPLVTAKLVAVEPMPGDIDKWILDDLRTWGRYKVTGQSEGASLVIEAKSLEKPPDYETRGGIPQPRRRDDPAARRKRSDSPLSTITVTDWVTGETLWSAHLLNRKPKKDEPPSPAGPNTNIFIRDMTPDQIAQRVTARLREYVGQLEQREGSK